MPFCMFFTDIIIAYIPTFKFKHFLTLANLTNFGSEKHTLFCQK